LLPGVGVSWYTWLEQGRPINASAQVLDAVARTLQLDAAERWHLYRLAEALPLRSWARTAVVPDLVRDVLRSLDPLPAVLINGRFDIIESGCSRRRGLRQVHEVSEAARGPVPPRPESQQVLHGVAENCGERTSAE
jgi:hypothetical protein